MLLKVESLEPTTRRVRKAVTPKPRLGKVEFPTLWAEMLVVKKGIYRSAVMRVSYLSHDRLDIQFACKELARHMNSPERFTSRNSSAW